VRSCSIIRIIPLALGQVWIIHPLGWPDISLSGIRADGQEEWPNSNFYRTKGISLQSGIIGDTLGWGICRQYPVHKNNESIGKI